MTQLSLSTLHTLIPGILTLALLATALILHRRTSAFVALAVLAFILAGAAVGGSLGLVTPWALYEPFASLLLPSAALTVSGDASAAGALKLAFIHPRFPPPFPPLTSSKSETGCRVSVLGWLWAGWALHGAASICLLLAAVLLYALADSTVFNLEEVLRPLLHFSSLICLDVTWVQVESAQALSSSNEAPLLPDSTQPHTEPSTFAKIKVEIAFLCATGNNSR